MTYFRSQILTMVGYKDLLCVVKTETPQRYRFEVYRMGNGMISRLIYRSYLFYFNFFYPSDLIFTECYVEKTASYFLSDGASGDEIAWVSTIFKYYSLFRLT